MFENFIMVFDSNFTTDVKYLGTKSIVNTFICVCYTQIKMFTILLVPKYNICYNILTFVDWWIGSWSLQIWLKNKLERDLPMMKLLHLFNEFILYIDTLHRNLIFLEQTCSTFTYRTK